ncbi:unnamed protein product [Ophioblennius macclurei]
MEKMLRVCVLVALLGAASSLSCRWMKDKFHQHSQEALALLEVMASNSTNSTEDADVDHPLAFPEDLYLQASNASAEDKVAFTVQVLRGVSGLFEEEHGAASWEESSVENFLSVVDRQADELSSCMGSHGRKKKSPKLLMYFRRLSQLVLKKQEHSAEAWEMIRTESHHLLSRVDLLVSSLTDN